MSSKSTKAQNTIKFREKLEAAMNKALPEGLAEDEYGLNSSVEILGKNPTYMDLLVHKLVDQACHGHDKSTQEVLDRLLGKATQINENVNLTMSYEDYLNKVSDEEDGKLDGKLDVELLDTNYTVSTTSSPSSTSKNDFYEEIGL